MCRLITNAELDRLSDGTLSELFREVSADLIRTEPGTPERRNCLASLETIGRAIDIRRTRGQPPSPHC